MPRPGPRRRIVSFRLYEPEIAWLDQTADEASQTLGAKVTRSDIIRRMIVNARGPKVKEEPVSEGICGQEAPLLFVNDVGASVPTVCELTFGHQSEWHESPNLVGGEPMRWRANRPDEPYVDYPGRFDLDHLEIQLPANTALRKE